MAIGVMVAKLNNSVMIRGLSKPDHRLKNVKERPRQPSCDGHCKWFLSNV